MQRGRQNPIAIRANYRAGEERGPIVGALPALAANQRDGDTDERGYGSNGIGAMMPGIGLHGGALDIPA